MQRLHFGLGRKSARWLYGTKTKDLQFPLWVSCKFGPSRMLNGKWTGIYKPPFWSTDHSERFYNTCHIHQERCSASYPLSSPIHTLSIRQLHSCQEQFGSQYLGLWTGTEPAILRSLYHLSHMSQELMEDVKPPDSLNICTAWTLEQTFSHHFCMQVNHVVSKGGGGRNTLSEPNSWSFAITDIFYDLRLSKMRLSHHTNISSC